MFSYKKYLTIIDLHLHIFSNNKNPNDTKTKTFLVSGNSLYTCPFSTKKSPLIN